MFVFFAACLSGELAARLDQFEGVSPGMDRAYLSRVETGPWELAVA